MANIFGRIGNILGNTQRYPGSSATGMLQGQTWALQNMEQKRALEEAKMLQAERAAQIQQAQVQRQFYDQYLPGVLGYFANNFSTESMFPQPPAPETMYGVKGYKGMFTQQQIDSGEADRMMQDPTLTPYTGQAPQTPMPGQASVPSQPAGAMQGMAASAPEMPPRPAAAVPAPPSAAPVAAQAGAAPQPSAAASQASPATQEVGVAASPMMEYQKYSPTPMPKMLTDIDIIRAMRSAGVPGNMMQYGLTALRPMIENQEKLAQSYYLAQSRQQAQQAENEWRHTFNQEKQQALERNREVRNQMRRERDAELASEARARIALAGNANLDEPALRIAMQSELAGIPVSMSARQRRQYFDYLAKMGVTGQQRANALLEGVAARGGALQGGRSAANVIGAVTQVLENTPTLKASIDAYSRDRLPMTVRQLLNSADEQIGDPNLRTLKTNLFEFVKQLEAASPAGSKNLETLNRLNALFDTSSSKAELYAALKATTKNLLSDRAGKLGSINDIITSRTLTPEQLRIQNEAEYERVWGESMSGRQGPQPGNPKAPAAPNRPTVETQPVQPGAVPTPLSQRPKQGASQQGSYGQAPAAPGLATYRATQVDKKPATAPEGAIHYDEKANKWEKFTGGKWVVIPKPANLKGQ